MTDRPHRVQLCRRKGWKMPPNTVSVARPTKFGNPFRPDGKAAMVAAAALGLTDGSLEARHHGAVALYAHWLAGFQHESFPSHLAFFVLPEWRDLGKPQPPTMAEIVVLRGQSLACWCSLDLPCHADQLLRIANAHPRNTDMEA